MFTNELTQIVASMKVFYHDKARDAFLAYMFKRASTSPPGVTWLTLRYKIEVTIVINSPPELKRVITWQHK